MSGRSRTPDDAKTSIYDPKRAKSATQRGTASGVHDVPIATPTDVDPRRPVEHGAPTEPTPRRQSEPLRVVSMKDTGETAVKAAREVPKAQIRSIAEVTGRTARPSGMGRLAPPRDPKEVRARRVRDNVIWACLAVILACGVTLAIWFLAR
jgi:hypothetical protein